MKSICLLGATGSIGDSTISVVEEHSEKIKIVGLAAHSNWKKMLEITQKHTVEVVVMFDQNAAQKLAEAVPKLKVLFGEPGLIEMAKTLEYDSLVNGLSGSIGCLPTLEAIYREKEVALANKETMVMAGEIIQAALKANPKAKIFPVDSEHNAIFQCLADRPISEVENIQITASGGPFRNIPKEEFSGITVEQALNHPTWSMGPKITIDSATLMNKGLEVLEAHYLFNIAMDDIKVVVHPGSTVHSFVQFKDGSLMAQMGVADMRVPILCSLSWPERWPLSTGRVNLYNLGKLEFYKPDLDKFPCLRLAFEAGYTGGTAPAILNAANEVSVPAFLNKKIRFDQIPVVNEQVVKEQAVIQNANLKQIIEADKEARVRATKIIEGL